MAAVRLTPFDMCILTECVCGVFVTCVLSVYLLVAHEQSSVVLPGLAVVALARSFLLPALESAHEKQSGSLRSCKTLEGRLMSPQHCEISKLPQGGKHVVCQLELCSFIKPTQLLKSIQMNKI